MFGWVFRKRTAAWASFGLGAMLVVPLYAGWEAFGAAPSGARLERMQASPNWNDGVFVNPEPLWNDALGMVAQVFDKSPYASPSAPLPVVFVERSRFAEPPATGLRITWLGHSSVLIEQDGLRILTDPVFGERISPVSFAGPKRFYAPPLALEDLPPLDAVVISHDHYDHLDHPTIVALREHPRAGSQGGYVPFIAPLGVGAHLASWGVPPTQIEELDWWEETQIGDLRIVCTPARHASGRTILDKDRTLWAGYALIGPSHRVFFSGDTGLFPAMREIGERLGPFDATLIEVGAYGRAWPDWHIGPEQAIRAHGMLRGRTFFPIHWGLFDLAFHGWTEPVERVTRAAQAAGVPIVVPRPGQSIEPERPPPFEAWWPALPWQTAAENPIVSTRVDAT